MTEILIVDDEWTTRLELDEMLQAAGYGVAGLAENGRQAVQMAEELSPDLILMDIVMPGDMNGIAAAREIRMKSDVPVIFISAYGDPEFIDEAKRVEPFGYVMKPFDESEVKAFVEIALYKSRLEKELAASNRELHQLRREWESIFHAVGIPALILDNDRRILHANTATLERVEMPEEKIIGRKCHEVFHKSARPHSNCPCEKMITSGVFETAEIEMDVLKGTFLVSCTPLFDDEGQLEKVIHIATDITERKRREMERERLQDRLRQAQKMEMMGTLTAGIAHDFNNLLSIIVGNLELAKEEGKSNPVLMRFLKSAEEAISKTGDLTHRLSSLSHGQAHLRRHGPIDPLLRRIHDEVDTRRGIECHMDVPEGLWPVSHDPTELHRAIRHVVTNAVEAMPRGGVIRIEAKNVTLGDRQRDSMFPSAIGKYVHIVIQDEGSGIKEEDLGRICDPYFSTKDRGAKKGMGLGLTTAYAEIERHDGYFHVQSVEGQGTTVSIFLPMVEKPVFQMHKMEKAPESVGSILVMDDEEEIRTLLKMMLERLGYQAETVKNGLEAVSAYKYRMNSGTPFDAVILDLTVHGGMGGRQTIQELIKMDANVRAIVSSGYADDPIMANFEEYGFLAAIRKPYQLAELRRGLQQAFGQKT